MRRRILWRLVDLVVIALFVLPAVAWAQLGPGEVPKNTQGRWWGSGCDTNGCYPGYGSTQDAAGAATAAAFNKAGFGDAWCPGGASKNVNKVYYFEGGFVNSGNCNVGSQQTTLRVAQYTKNCSTGAQTTSSGSHNLCVSFEGSYCPEGSTVKAGDPNVCVCNAGWVKNGDICVQDNCFTRGAKSAAEYRATVGSTWLDGPEGQTCHGGCVLSWANRTMGYDGQWYGRDPYPSGKTCNQNGGDQVLPEAVDPYLEAPIDRRCPAGQCPSEVDGAHVCMPCAESRDTTSTTNQDGAQGTKSTVCKNGLCTTTESTGGISGGEKTTVESLPDYCSRYPLSGHCSGVTNNGSGASKVDTGLTSGPGGGTGGDGTCQTPPCGDDEPSTFGGACAAGFSCSGDAVQCAIAKDQHMRHCQLMETPNALSEVGDGAMTGDARPPGHPGAAGGPGTSLAFSSVIDQTNLLSGGCPADVSFSVLGQSMSLPFSSLCPELAMLGQVLVGISMLAAVGIVFKG